MKIPCSTKAHWKWLKYIEAMASSNIKPFCGAKSLARKAMPEEAAKSVAEARRRNVAEGSLQKLHHMNFV